MTQTTIREKLIQATNNSVSLDHIIRTTARLVCDEMEKSIHCCKEDEENAKLKTQKILKALE